MARGTLTLVFDDGYTDVYEHVLPLLRRYGMRAVFAVPVETDKVAQTEQAPVTPLETWTVACQRDGHELAAHGVSHRPLTTLSDEELDRELRGSQRATGATTLVYPGGAHDARVQAVAQRHFTAARTTVWGFDSLPPRDALALRTFNVTRKNFSVLRWNLRVILAWICNRWMIETYHRVTDDPTAFHAVSLRDLDRHIRFMSRLPIRVATIADMRKE